MLCLFRQLSIPLCQFCQKIIYTVLSILLADVIISEVYCVCDTILCYFLSASRYTVNLSFFVSRYYVLLADAVLSFDYSVRDIVLRYVYSASRYCNMLCLVCLQMLYCAMSVLQADNVLCFVYSIKLHFAMCILLAYIILCCMSFLLHVIHTPAGIWCENDVGSTSMRRHHVASTLIRRHFGTKCPLGLYSAVCSCC